jgi:hypothetical protein
MKGSPTVALVVQSFPEFVPRCGGDRPSLHLPGSGRGANTSRPSAGLLTKPGVSASVRRLSAFSKVEWEMAILHQLPWNDDYGVLTSWKSWFAVQRARHEIECIARQYCSTARVFSRKGATPKASFFLHCYYYGQRARSDARAAKPVSAVLRRSGSGWISLRRSF